MVADHPSPSAGYRSPGLQPDAANKGAVLAQAAIAGALLVLVLALVLRRRHGRQFEAFLRAVDDELEPLLERLRRAAERIDAAEARGVRADELALRFPELEQDELTGLRNRVGYEADLQREIEIARRTGRPLSLLLLDVGGSAAERDAVLRELARLLGRLTRATDTIFRRGEDELGVLLPETPAEGARRFHSRVRDAVVRAEFSHSGPPTLAVGLVEWRPDESTEAFDARAEASVGSFEPTATLRPART
jgi:diguanylate cyclase (GGDEF)-like protein